jgi:hypothetical protein
MQNMLSFIASEYHEPAVLETILHTHQDIWGDRYAAWDRMTPWEKVALTVEGMRGGHFSGIRRRGDVLIEDQGDRFDGGVRSVRQRRCCAGATRKPGVAPSPSPCMA